MVHQTFSIFPLPRDFWRAPVAQNNVFRWHDHHRTFLLCYDGPLHHFMFAKEWLQSVRILNGPGIAAVCKKVGAFINNRWICQRNKRLVFGHTSASCGLVLATTASQENRRVSNAPDRIHVSLAFSMHSAPKAHERAVDGLPVFSVCTIGSY